MLSTVARALLALLIVARVAQGQAAAPTRADSLQAAYRRAQRLVTDGQGADGRALMEGSARERGRAGVERRSRCAVLARDARRSRGNRRNATICA